MSETKIVWHPYPKEKPKKSDWYFVTTKNKKVYIDYFFAKPTIPGELIEFEFLDDEAIAWAEIKVPKPYEAENERSND